MKLNQLFVPVFSIAAVFSLVSCQTATPIDIDTGPAERLGKAHPNHPYSEGFRKGREDALKGLRARPRLYSRANYKRSEQNDFNRGYMNGWKQSKPPRFQSNVDPKPAPMSWWGQETIL